VIAIAGSYTGKAVKGITAAARIYISALPCLAAFNAPNTLYTTGITNTTRKVTIAAGGYSN
jgi:hypothetical protein